MNVGHYSFPAIRGRQGENDYYLTQCPLRLVPRIFLFDEADVPVTLRQVHSLNAARVREFARYLIAQPSSYILTPLVVAVDDEIEFDPLVDGSPAIGRLRIPMTARMVIQDGQHRWAAVRHALTENPALGDNTVPIMLLPDPHLERSSRIYADLNLAQAKRNLSQRILYDQDSSLAALVRQLVEEIPLFRGLTALDKTTISNRSTALFTLSAVYQATQALLGIGKRDQVSPAQTAIAREFWEQLGHVIPEWYQVIQGKRSTAQLRKCYVHAHSVTLVAIGMAGRQLVTSHPDDWSKRLSRLGELDWSRENTALWEGRAMLRGRMSKARDSVLLTANVVKQTLGLELTEQEQELEQRLTNS